MSTKCIHWSLWIVAGSWKAIAKEMTGEATDAHSSPSRRWQSEAAAAEQAPCSTAHPVSGWLRQEEANLSEISVTQARPVPSPSLWLWAVNHMHESETI